jgi:hypothetical protein
MEIAVPGARERARANRWRAAAASRAGATAGAARVCTRAAAGARLGAMNARDDLPIRKHPNTLRAEAPSARKKPLANFARGKSLYVADVDSYELHRSMLYALGAESVSNKMLAHVNVVVHGKPAPPAKAKAKYPKGEYVSAQAVLPLFRQEVDSFAGFIKALREHGFTVRNPSDEGDPQIDFFALPLQKRSLHATLLHYLATSDFIRAFVHPPHVRYDERQDGYEDFTVKTSAGEVTWFYAWQVDAFRRVYAQRGDGDYPLEIKGEQLLTVEPIFWTASTGLVFQGEAHVDSIDGLFIQAGIDARTGEVQGVAISRVWT